MFELASYMWGLAIILIVGVATWIVSVIKRDVSIVDSLWSLMFLIAAVVYALVLPETGPRATLTLVLVALWSFRLAGYIAWRNWGEGEDYRYQQIRANNEPNFTVKSLYIVFGFQGILAWIISLPLLAAMASLNSLNALDYVGVLVWAVGMFFETVGDWQLARFKADPVSKGKVLNSGLWRYTRHPNYFGNSCIWWGLFLIAWAAGGWWSIVSPIMMTFLLLKVSGVAMLEKDIGERRPGYREYVTQTNAFLPGRPKIAATTQLHQEGVS